MYFQFWIFCLKNTGVTYKVVDKDIILTTSAGEIDEYNQANRKITGTVKRSDRRTCYWS